MKYHIDTIPVWDALHLGSECPLCALRRKTERTLVQRSLGASVMSPDTRQKVNERGFCATHHQLMYAAPGGNKLGHALMVLSHLQTQKAGIGRAFGKGGRSKASKNGLLGRFSKPAVTQGSEAGLPYPNGCLVCDELSTLSQRQTASLLHLWKTEEAFRQAFTASKGLCAPDTEAALKMAPELLSGERLDSFRQVATQLLTDSLDRLEEELLWFTQKFDYRNTQAPWGNSKDALERTVNKLRGWCLGDEPMQDET